MTIGAHFQSWANESDLSDSVADVIVALCGAAEQFFSEISTSAVGDYNELAASNLSGDTQTIQDAKAHELFRDRVRRCSGVSHLASEEADEPERLGTGNWSIAIDPFDGSKAYKLGVPPGTIFAIFNDSNNGGRFRGANVCAAGVFIYSQKLELIVAARGKVLRVESGSWRNLPELGNSERFICANFANYKKWDIGWQNFFAERVLALRGNRGLHNTRWYGSLALHTKIVALGGGLFAYPPDSRSGYGTGHLRLVYEAIPVAYLTEALGGAATDGTSRILDIVPQSLHQKVPLVFGEQSLVRELSEDIQASR